jgi:hypothetical protein
LRGIGREFGSWKDISRVEKGLIECFGVEGVSKEGLEVGRVLVEWLEVSRVLEEGFGVGQVLEANLHV